MLFRSKQGYLEERITKGFTYDSFLYKIEKEVKRFKHILQHIERELAYFDFLNKTESEANLQDNKNQVMEISPEKISIIGNKIDVVRIFEAMRKAKITSVKQGEMKKYGNIFTDENFVDKYYTERRRLERDQSSSNSAELIEFIKILCESSLKDKDPEIEQIITHLELLQKKY